MKPHYTQYKLIYSCKYIFCTLDYAIIAAERKSGCNRYSWIEGAHEQRRVETMTDVSVAAVQMACTWDRDKNIATAQDLVRRAAGRGARTLGR